MNPLNYYLSQSYSYGIKIINRDIKQLKNGDIVRINGKLYQYRVLVEKK